MKRLLKIFLIITALLVAFQFSAKALDTSDLENSLDELKNSLSDEAKEDLEGLGVDSYSFNNVSNISFTSVISLISEKIGENSVKPFSSSAVVIAVIILYALLNGYKNNLRAISTSQVLSVVSTLCITCALIFPIIDLVDSSIEMLKDASNFMLLYIPVMIAILSFSGHVISSASYYSMVMIMCQTVSQIASKFIAPILNIYLGFCVSSAITDRVNLKGFCALFSKIIKWMIAFIMTVFSAMLTIRSIITTAYDSVTTRAVRFTLSSFIPVVGAAISEAYKSIQGSLNLLRSGAGVFVIIAICIVFLPSITKCLMWIVSINLSKAIAQTVGVNEPCELLCSISSVVSTVFAIIVSIMAIFIVSTALLLSMGGAN